MKHIILLLFSFTFLWSQIVHAQEESIIVKFTGEDIEFDEIKVFKIYGTHNFNATQEPETVECGGVIVKFPNDTEDSKEIKKPVPPKKSDKTKESNPEILKDTILLFNVDSKGFLKINSLRGVYYQYKKGCVVYMDEINATSESDTIIVEIPKNNKYIVKTEIEGEDIYYQPYLTYCLNRKIYENQRQLKKYGFPEFQLKERLSYSDSTLELYEKIKKGNWYHFSDSLSEVLFHPYDLKNSILGGRLKYPKIAEKFQVEGLVIFKLVLTYENKISDIELVFGNEPILVTEIAAFLNQYNYYKGRNCYLSSYFKHYFDKIPEDLSTEIYVPVEYSILMKYAELRDSFLIIKE